MDFDICELNGTLTRDEKEFLFIVCSRYTHVYLMTNKAGAFNLYV